MNSVSTSLQHLSVDVRGLIAMQLEPWEVALSQRVCKVWYSAFKHHRIWFSILKNSYPLEAAKVKKIAGLDLPTIKKITLLYIYNGLPYEIEPKEIWWLGWFSSIYFQADELAKKVFIKLYGDTFIEKYLESRDSHILVERMFNKAADAEWGDITIDDLTIPLEDILSACETPPLNHHKLAHMLTSRRKSSRVSIRLLKILQRTGADLKGQNSNGETLLHTALKDRHDQKGNSFPLVKWLLEQGVDPNIPNNEGKLPDMQNASLYHRLGYHWIQGARAVKKLQRKRFRGNISRPEELLDAARNGLSTVLKRAKTSEINGHIPLSNTGKYWPLTESLLWGNLDCAKAVAQRLDDNTLFSYRDKSNYYNPINQVSVIGHPDPIKSREIALFVGDLLNRCLSSHNLAPPQKIRAACGLASTLLCTYLEGLVDLNTFQKAFGNYWGPLNVYDYNRLKLALTLPQLLLFPDWAFNQGDRSLVESYSSRCYIWPKIQQAWRTIFRCVEKSERINILSNIWWNTLMNLTAIENLSGCVSPTLLSLTLPHNRANTTWLHLFCEAFPTRGDHLTSPEALQTFLDSLPEELLDFSKPDEYGQSPLHFFFWCNIRSNDDILEPKVLETFLRFALSHCEKKLGRVREKFLGCTLLHTVCERVSDPKTVEISIRLLLEAGHPTSCRNDLHRTPLQVAKHYKNKTAIRTLQEWKK